jgi:outer membrane receptor protein involved in Fe transport
LFSLGVTKALSPNTLNEFHLSYMRFANRVGQPVGGVGPKLSDQGFVEGPGTLGIVPLAPKIEGIENVSFNDFTFGVDTTGETQVNNTYQGTDNFSKVIGKHSLKVGGGLHLDQVNVNPDAVFNGSFQFVGTETGSDFADFLLGVASYYRQGDSKSFYLRNKYVGLFAQDNWQVRPNVTLTYGLRWEYLQSLLISALKRLAAVRLPPLPPLSILLSISYGLLLVSYNGILQGGFSAGLSRCSHYALIRTSFTRQGLHRTASAE